MLFPAMAPAAVATFGSVNTPQCPVCHTPVPVGVPEYLPVITNVSDGSTTSLANVRDLFCQNCWARFVANAANTTGAGN